MKIKIEKPKSQLTKIACITSLIALTVLSGCTSSGTVNKTEKQYQSTKTLANIMAEDGRSIGDLADENVRGGHQFAENESKKQQNMPIGRYADAPYIGSVMVPVTNEDRLPSVFNEPFTLDFGSDSGQISLSTAMARLSKMTSVPIRIQPDVYGSDAPSAAPSSGGTQKPQPLPMVNGKQVPFPLPTGAAGARPGVAPLNVSSNVPNVMPSGGANKSNSLSQASAISLSNIDMNYSGTLSGFLDNVTDQLGLSWEYRDNTIVLMKYSTEMHELFTFPGTQKFSFSSSGSGSGTSGGGGASNSASANLSVDESGELAPLATIEKSIANMIASVAGSSVMRTDGSGRLLVKTSREMQSRVRDYIKSENNAMRRQAQIQFDIYSITVDEGDERGINWSAILQKAGQAAQMKFAGPSTLASSLSSSTSLNILEGNSYSKLLGDSSLLLNAMHSSGYSAQHRPVSLLALNRQWGRISRLSTEYYLSETTPAQASSTGGAGLPGLKSDKITTGDQYVAMPQILDDNTILLKFGLSLSDLVGMFDISAGEGSNMQKIQAPKITAVNAQFPVALRPGEVAAVTGLTRLVSSNANRRLTEGAAVGFGGSDAITYKREHFMIFIRPVLL